MYYILNPLRINVVNVKEEIIKTYICINKNTPKYIIDIIFKYKYNNSTKQNIWNKEQATQLKKFYGDNYIEKLNPDTTVKNTLNASFGLYTVLNAGTVRGGKITLNENKIDISKSALINECKNIHKYKFLSNEYMEHDNTILKPIKEIGGEITLNSLNANKVEETISYELINIYNEDSIYDLKQKIYLLTKIDYYRQNISYNINDECGYRPYIVEINNISQVVNISDLINVSNKKLLDLCIDDYFYTNKNLINVINNEHNTTMQMGNNMYVNNCIVLDLNNLINANDININKVLDDKLKYQLFYYGIIIKYFPQLTVHSCKEILLGNLNFPNLIFDKKSIEEIYSNQDKLISLKDKFVSKKIAVKESILSTTLFVKKINIIPNINLRNIVDLLATNETIISIVGRFFIDSSSLIESNYDISNNNIRYSYEFPITIIKRSLYSYRHDIEPILTAPIKNNTVKILINSEHNIQIVLNIDGSYYILCKWDEMDEVVYDDIYDKISIHSLPIIEHINNFKTNVFITGGKYGQLTPNIVLHNIDICFYWPYATSQKIFNNIKNNFMLYEQCNILKIKGIHQSGAYVIYFKKGMRVKSELLLKSLINQYSFMTDEIDYLKWQLACKGVVVKIYNRLIDIKVEVINVNNIEEYEYIKSFVLSIFNNNSTKDIDISIFSKIKNINKLQLQDPNLFNLKKYNPNSKVYSVICQSKKQPVIYSKEEYKLLNDKKQSELIKYWNFTKEEETYYHCPSKTYGKLNFRVGIHPKGYCLPCCKKGKFNKDLVNNCLQKKVMISEDIKNTTHIFTYGKELNVDRISLLPNVIYNIFEVNDLYATWVRQTTKSINKAGLLYSIAYLIDSDYKVFIKSILKVIEDMGDTYKSLGYGSAAFFRTNKELCENIYNIFIKDVDELGIMSKGGVLSEDKWYNIIIELTYLTYNLVIVRFVNNSDPDSIDNTDIILSPELNEYIRNVDINIGFIISNKINTYPIVRINSVKEYNITENKYENTITIFNDAKLISVIKKIFNTKKINEFNFNFIINFVKTNKKYKIKAQMSNTRNQCYGVLLSINDEILYIPILYSILNNDYPIIFDINKIINNKKILDKLISDIKIMSVKNGIIYNDKLIGYVLDNDLHIYFKPENINDTYKNITLNYDSDKLNIDIVNYLNNYTIDSTEINKINYNNNLYNLLCIEFAFILNKNRNIELRNKIIKLVKSIDITNNNSITYAKQLIQELIQDKSDIDKFKQLLFYLIDNNNIEEFTYAFKLSKFNFDIILLDSIFETDNKLEKIRDLLKDSVFISNIIPELPNYYNTCDNGGEQCKNNKLIISQEKFDKYTEILLSDILNNNKKYLVSNITSGIIDNLNFIKRENENIALVI